MQTNIPSESLRRHQRCEMTGCVTESLREDCKLLVGPVPHPFSGGVGGGGFLCLIALASLTLSLMVLFSSGSTFTLCGLML